PALLMHLGGTPARPDPTMTADGLRAASYALNIHAAWESAQDGRRHVGSPREYGSTTPPCSTGSASIKIMTSGEGEGRVRAAFPAAVYARLREVKSKFDPGNLFHGAQNIPPP